MTSGGNCFNDFLETVPTSEITTKAEKTFLAFSRWWPWACSSTGRHAAAPIAPNLNPAALTTQHGYVLLLLLLLRYA